MAWCRAASRWSAMRSAGRRMLPRSGWWWRRHCAVLGLAAGWHRTSSRSLWRMALRSWVFASCEEMGFRAEARLRDQVRDADGTKHDIAILSLDVLRQGGQHRAYGIG